MTSAEIRQQFIDFFVSRHGHTFVPSSPVVPLDDPTLLFTNAGMNQFKPIFLGLEKRPYTRAANTQKCIRAGGKHNDLDDVGRSRRHHTFFEMLGNWSFGDYFKRGAIEMAWELLTKVWKLDPSRLHASCYEGDEKNGIPRDTEAAELWKEIAGLSDDQIHYFGADNFWMMGDTGPCGPCTEIYIDRTPDKTGGKSVNGDDPRVMEIWNLVFIQYNREASGKLSPLPQKHVDTGMGFERICQVLQNKQDNYAIDLWTPLFAAIEQLSGLMYTGKFPKTNAVDPTSEAEDPQLRYDIAFRVIADHVRCLTFAINDGAIPSNEGRGYVLRRILRRAVRFGRQQLGLEAPFMHKLVPVVVDSMGTAFPELLDKSHALQEIIRQEEISFGRTLGRGIALFEDAACDAIASAYGEKVGDNFAHVIGLPRVPEDVSGLEYRSLSKKIEITVPFGPARQQDCVRHLGISAPVISSVAAFKLHDTYGFPIDLTRVMAQERGMSVDIAGYEKLMEQARELARAGGKSVGSALADLPPGAMDELARSVKPTDDRAKFSHDPVTAQVMAIWNGDDLGLSPSTAFEDEELAIILDRTNFYSEMGGQVGDSGTITSAAGAFDVQTTRTVAGYVLHIGRIRSGKIAVGDAVSVGVSAVRGRTEKNHTGTHLANWALRETLGEGVQQKGSLVDPEKLRFDFSHSKSMTEDEIARVEELVNDAIAKNLPVFAQEAKQEEALKINGLRAVFGEKYPPMVRVVSIGAPVDQLIADPKNPKWRQFSVEFCGGTHLANSKEIGRFAITAEESVSKGIRRIVAVTDDDASDAFAASDNIDVILSDPVVKDQEIGQTLEQLQQALQFRVVPLLAKRRAQKAIAELQSRQRSLEKSARAQSAGGGVDAVKVAATLLEKAAPIGSGKLVIGEIPGASDDQLRSAIDSLRKKSPVHAILLASAGEASVTFVAAVSDEIIAKGLKAGDWIKQVATAAGGGGGGRPQMAQGSGKDPSKLSAALETARQVAAKFS